ncbi:DUF1990 family protein [Hamadaea flava]|uniref:DUF1990 family protein n=1 Tax=Hamadaea flava TaxID=1742688 RepID=A0ABV8LFU8_9ACTN|nr:DUF1990 family protein [Hamadaea flava]
MTPSGRRRTAPRSGCPRERTPYGTVLGHPESGEEAFVVQRNADNLVELEIVAFSRPATRLARFGGAITRATQSWITHRYVAAIR